MVWAALRSGHQALRIRSSGFAAATTYAMQSDSSSPGSTTRWYRFDFSGLSPELTNVPKLSGPVNIVHRIAASALAGWVERRKSFFYVRAYSRRFSTLYELCRQDERVRIEPIVLPDLLMHYLLNVAPGSETAAPHRIDLEIEAVSDASCSNTASENSQ